MSARAALELESVTGIDSTTIARLNGDIDHAYGLREGSVLVVDEAGMVGSRALARLADHAAATESKLVLVGDDRQLPEIDAGGAFRGLAEQLGASRLTEVHRQVHEWDREALDDLRHGRIREWADAYRDHGRIVARTSAVELHRALIDDWWEAARNDACDAVMIAHRRADVAELNALARARMLRDGRLEEEQLVMGDRAFATGDRVIARRNDRREGVINGTRGRVAQIDQRRRVLTLEEDAGKRTEISSAYLESGWLDHGYAITAHAAQGATVDRAFVLGSDDVYREWGYTALTRHNDEARFCVVSPGSVERSLPGLEREADAVGDDVAAVLGESRRKTMAIDVLEGDRKRDTQRRDRLEAIADAEERIAALDRERAGLRLLQRRRRKDLDNLIARQQEAIDRWSAAEPDDQAPEKPQRQQKTVASRAERQLLRSSAIDPSEAIVQQIGRRPEGLRDRDLWCRAASRLVGEATPDPSPSELERTIYDSGLEL